MGRALKGAFPCRSTPQRRFNTVIEGPLRQNDDGLWAIYEGDEELSYWDEGQELEIEHAGEWLKGPVVWTGDAYALVRDGGEPVAIAEGTMARRRVGGSI